MQREGEDTILIINDSPDQLDLVSSILRQSGYQTATACDGEEGYAIARRLRPSLVISDVTMPRIDGIELCRLLRADTRLKDTPILLISALRKNTESVVEGLQAGADDYLEAPFDPLQLVARVVRLLERARVEAHYRNIVEQASDIIYTHDLKGCLTSINAAGVIFTGRTQEDLIGRQIDAILGLADGDARVQEAIAKLRQEGMRSEEVCLLNASGEERWLEFNQSLICNREGEPIGVRGVARDITERKAIEEALRRSEERYREMIENAYDVIYTTDLSGHYLSVNKAAERATGYTREELLSFNWKQIVAPEYEPLTRQMIALKLSKTEHITFYEVEIIAKDGRRIPFEVSTQLIYEGGQPIGVQGIARDITERKRAEEALRESEAKFRILSEASSEGIAIHDHGVIVEANQAYAQMGGYTLDEVIGQHILNFTAPECHELILKQSAQAGAASYEAFGQKKDGTIFPVQLTGKAINYQGHVARVVVVRDMTERYQAEANLRERAEREAEFEKMRSLGQLSAGVAHNFNNALAAILGRTQLLLRAVHDERQRRSLQVIETASQDAAEIVRRIQTFARRVPTEQLRRVSLAGLISDAMQLTRIRWKDDARAQGLFYDVRFVADFTGSDLIEANASEIREVFVNLIFNALDAMPAGGHIELRETLKGNLIFVEVQDTGEGISPDLQTRIFEPFFTTKGPQGSGLGLAVSYGIIQRHNGDISVTSAPGEGTTFIICLPRQEDEASAAVAEEQTDLPARQVLVVDNDEQVREVLVETLEELQQQVTSVGNATAAIKELAAQHFDLMITDLSMPDMDGFALAAHVRREHPNTRIVLSTGYGQTIATRPNYDQLVDGILNKPFQLSDVEATLRALVK